MLEEKIKKEIIKKIFGMGVMRLSMGEKPIISPGEFRFIIGCYGIKKQEWFKILKKLENDKIVDYKKQYIYIFLRPEAIMRIEHEKQKEER